MQIAITPCPWIRLEAPRIPGPAQADGALARGWRTEFRRWFLMNAPGMSDAGFLAYICHESRNHRVPVSRLPAVCQGRPRGPPVLRAHQGRLGISSPLITA